MKVLNKEWVEQNFDYKPFTTFFDDFSIAERFGNHAINDTYNRISRDWKNDYKYWTELVFMLSLKCNYYYDVNASLCELYGDLYDKAYDFALENFNEDEKLYFFKVLD